MTTLKQKPHKCPVGKECPQCKYNADRVKQIMCDRANAEAIAEYPTVKRDPHAAIAELSSSKGASSLENLSDGLRLTAFGQQVGGTHYTDMKIQPFEFSMANGLNPMEHNAIKYVARRKPESRIQDLEKAIHTIQLLIEWEKSNEQN